MTYKLSGEKEATFAEEAFVVDVQILLHRVMEEKGISRADLARAMNVSRARISQIFSDDCKNFTVRLLARALHAVKEEPEVVTKSLLARMRTEWEVVHSKNVKHFDDVDPAWDEKVDAGWRPANDNRMARLAQHYRMAA